MTTFLPPKSNQYPYIDEAATKLVDLLIRRISFHPENGLHITLRSYGDGFAVVDDIYPDEGWLKKHNLPRFHLHFGRPQGRVEIGTFSRWNDCGAISSIGLEKKHIRIYDDFSGPSFGLFVGNEEQWETMSKNWLRYGPGVNSKLWQRPRTYLSYTGSASIDRSYYYSGRLSPFLIHDHDHDLGREYHPVGEEPKYFVTEEVLKEMGDLMNKVIEAVKVDDQEGK